MVVTGSALTFRALVRPDFALLSQWMAAPHVQPWWREEFDPASVEARYGPSVDGADPTECFVVALDDRPIGFVQRYLLRDNPHWQRALVVTGTPPDGAGIDYLIGAEDLVGRGLGPEIIGRFVDDTWARYGDITAIVVDVAVENRRSWRALEKAGFVRVWSGLLDSDDPSDDGPNHVYLRRRGET
ncbi:MAG TPA: GNAT family N-acetyltransferase [Acidimicrobiales bacterium]|jgi:aminoglycoside 6'-N-acetyltransferase